MIGKEDLKYDMQPCCDGNVDNRNKGKRIDVRRIIEKLDSLFDKNDLPAAGRLLEYWKSEAKMCGDLSGELSIVSEMIGYYRKTLEKEKALNAVSRACELISALKNENTVSAATVYLNAATTLKAFGKADEAMPLYEKTYNIYKENLDGSDPRFGGFYNNVGLALTDIGEKESAEKAYKAAISVMLQKDGGKAEAAITYVNLAHLYEADGKTADIENALDTAAALLESSDLSRNGYYAFVLSKCAPSMRYFGREETAEKMERLVKEIYERS